MSEDRALGGDRLENGGEAHLLFSEDNNAKPSEDHSDPVIPEDSQINTLEEADETITTLTQEKEDLHQSLLRIHADFENTKKRLAREKEQDRKYATQQLLMDVISFADDLGRVMEQVNKDDATVPVAIREGIELIEKRLIATLEQNWGLKCYGERDDIFDPDRHEAIAVENAGDGSEGQAYIVEVYQKGYSLHDRIIRSAKVKVTKNDPGTALPENEKIT